MVVWGPGTDCCSFQDPFIGLWFIIPCSIFPPLHQKKFGTKTAQLLPTRKKPIKKKHQTIDHEKSPRKTPTEPRKNADRVATGSVTRETSGRRIIPYFHGFRVGWGIPNREFLIHGKIAWKNYNLDLRPHPGCWLVTTRTFLNREFRSTLILPILLGGGG